MGLLNGGVVPSPCIFQEGFMGKIGDRINELSGKEIPLTIFAGGEEFNLVFNPVPEEKLILNATDHAKKKAEGDDDAAFSNEMIKYLAAAGMRDEEGNLAWDSPDEIKVNDLVFYQLQNFMLKHVMGDMLSLSGVLTDEEIKK